MTASAGERIALLAAVALLGGVLALAVGERRAEDATSAALAGAVASGSGWNRAFAGSRGVVGDAQRTTCGQILTARSLGATHPVLPCRAKLILRHDGVQVLTEVIDNALVEPGRQLELTAGLAELLGIAPEATEEIDWRFAVEATS